MTTARTERSVLIIGRSQLVLDEAVERLEALGYRAAATNDFSGDIAGRFAPGNLDVVVFGGQVPPDRRAELRAEIAATNPSVIFVQGLAGIPGLIVNQIESALAAGCDEGAHARYAAAARTIMVRLRVPEHVIVTAWWTTSIIPPDPKSDSLVLLEERLPAGDHKIPIPDHIPAERAFATVRMGESIEAFSIEGMVEV